MLRTTQQVFTILAGLCLLAVHYSSLILKGLNLLDLVGPPRLHAKYTLHLVVLYFTDTVSHLGHLLSYNLDDTSDIIRATKDLNRTANFVLCVFPFADISVKNYLVKSFCLSMYGCSLWSLSCKNLRIIECALNKLFWRVWNLPSLSHTRIVHCVSNIQSVSKCIFKHFNSMLSGAISSPSPLIRCVFSDSSQCGHSFVGYNFSTVIDI